MTALKKKIIDLLLEFAEEIKKNKNSVMNNCERYTDKIIGVFQEKTDQK